MSRDWNRDDPVKDAEDWVSREEERPALGTCPVCGEVVYGENGKWEKDDAFEIDGEIIHEDCVIEYLKLRGYRA